MVSILEHYPKEDTDAVSVRLSLANRPIERDTRLISARYVWIGDIRVAVERWTWDGIPGSSAVILTDSVRDLDDATGIGGVARGGARTSSVDPRQGRVSQGAVAPSRRRQERRRARRRS
jgi:hypothetical protein